MCDVNVQFVVLRISSLISSQMCHHVLIHQKNPFISMKKVNTKMSKFYHTN